MGSWSLRKFSRLFDYLGLRSPWKCGCSGEKLCKNNCAYEIGSHFNFCFISRPKYFIILYQAGTVSSPSCQISWNRSAGVIRRRKTLDVFNPLKRFLENLYFLFENACWKFGKDMTFLSGIFFVGGGFCCWEGCSLNRKLTQGILIFAFLI